MQWIKGHGSVPCQTATRSLRGYGRCALMVKGVLECSAFIIDTTGNYSLLR